MNNFKDLEAYKVAHELSYQMYLCSRAWPKEEIFGLTSQIRRASVSVISNLSEGLGRITAKDTTHFLAIARGSSYELEAQAELAFRLEYLRRDEFDLLMHLNEQARKLINGIITRYSKMS